MLPLRLTAALVSLLVLTACSSSTGSAPDGVTLEGLPALVRDDIALGPEGLLLRDPVVSPDVREVSLALAALRRQGDEVQEPRSSEYQAALTQALDSATGVDVVDARADARLAPPTAEQWQHLAGQAATSSPLLRLRVAHVAERLRLPLPAEPLRCARPTSELEQVEQATYAPVAGLACTVDSRAPGRLLDQVVASRQLDAETALAVLVVSRCEPCDSRERAQDEAERMAEALEEELGRGTALDTATAARVLLAAPRRPHAYPGLRRRLTHVVRFEGRYADDYGVEPLHELRTVQVLRHFPDPRFDSAAQLAGRSAQIEAALRESAAGDVPRDSLQYLAQAGRGADRVPSQVLGSTLDVAGLMLRLNSGSCPGAGAAALAEGAPGVRLLARALLVRLQRECGQRADGSGVRQAAEAGLRTETDPYVLALQLQARCAVDADLPEDVARRVRSTLADHEREVVGSASPWDRYSHLAVWGAVEARRLLDGACGTTWWRIGGT